MSSQLFQEQLEENVRTDGTRTVRMWENLIELSERIASVMGEGRLEDSSIEKEKQGW